VSKADLEVIGDRLRLKSMTKEGQHRNEWILKKLLDNITQNNGNVYVST